jgi:hypothetical protein
MTWVEVFYCNVMENDDLRIFSIEVPVSSQESGRSCICLLGTVNGHKYSSPSILRYIFQYKITFFKKIIVKSFLNGFWSFLHQKKQKYLKIICLF